MSVIDTKTAKAHPELHSLLVRLQQIHNSVSNFQPLTAKPPILDTSLDIGTGQAEDSHWLQQEHIPGLKKLRETVRIDLDVLEKFLNDPQSAHLPPLSTNAPYLLAVWSEVLSAPPPIVSVFKSVPLHPVDPSSDPRKKVSQKPPAAKIDIVADNGRRWIRVNTIKNARIIAEFREIDSYLTDSSDDSDADPADIRPTLAQTEFDNSVLRMGRALLTAAKANPVEGTSETPQITMRLTRLDPSIIDENGDESDPRIAQTLQCLRDMGIDVEIGERDEADLPAIATATDPSLSILPTAFLSTTHVNLDLSVLIALASDLTHAPLPKTVDEANKRFIPPQSYREWKQKRKVVINKNAYKVEDEAEINDIPQDLAKHSRALTNQVLQEMDKGLLQEIYDRLSAASTVQESDSSPTAISSPSIEFWTTSEARDRCLRIVSKIGGPNEKRRAHALFYTTSSLSSEILSLSQAEEWYWEGSRYPFKYIPLLPIHQYPSSSTPNPILSLGPSLHKPTTLPVFSKSLAKTCQDILAQETIPHPRALPEDIVKGIAHGPGNSEIQRATVTKANPRLTAHTVQSMLWGAELGWTTLTANKTSVKAILREMKAARVSGRLDGKDDVGSEGDGGGHSTKAAIWIVDPRSLAEGMSNKFVQETSYVFR